MVIMFDEIKSLIVKDSQWRYTQYANPRRGWHDYYRLIKTWRSLTKEELELMIKYLDSAKDCPAGQKRVRGHKLDQSFKDIQLRDIKGTDFTESDLVFTYKFTCALDSSD